jgi:hypothetical protein
MTTQNASVPDSGPEQVPPALSYDDLFTDAYQVGFLDYLRLYQTMPLTTLDIDRFIERTMTNPAHPRAWNAGYLAGWMAGMVAVEGPFLPPWRRLRSAQTHLYPVEEGNPISKHLHHSSSTEQDISTVVPVIPMEDSLVHTATHPFCDDPRCPCHDDQGSISTVHEQVQQGLFTPQEATDFVNGKIGWW